MASKEVCGVPSPALARGSPVLTPSCIPSLFDGSEGSHHEGYRALFGISRCSGTAIYLSSIYISLPRPASAILDAASVREEQERRVPRAARACAFPLLKETLQSHPELMKLDEVAPSVLVGGGPRSREDVDGTDQELEDRILHTLVSACP